MSDKTKHDEDPQDPRTTRTALAREIHGNLKRVYAATLDEEIPDRFRALLAQLREKEGRA